MIVPAEVEVRLDSIRRAWERGGNYEFWLGLSTPSDDVDAFGRALARANRAEAPMASTPSWRPPSRVGS